MGIGNKKFNYLYNEEAELEISRILIVENDEKDEKIIKTLTKLLNSDKNLLENDVYVSLTEYFIE